MPCTTRGVRTVHCLSTLPVSFSLPLLFGLLVVFFGCRLKPPRAFGAKGLNKNLYSGKKSHVKEPKALPHVCCIMSCCPHFSLAANRYGTEVNSASSIHIYHFSKGCSREDEDQYKFIFSGNGKYLNCSAIRHKDDFWGYRACVLSHCPDNSRRV